MKTLNHPNKKACYDNNVSVLLRKGFEVHHHTNEAIPYLFKTDSNTFSAKIEVLVVSIEFNDSHNRFKAAAMYEGFIVSKRTNTRTLSITRQTNTTEAILQILSKLAEIPNE